MAGWTATRDSASEQSQQHVYDVYARFRVGVADRLFNGHWQSETVNDGYVEDSVQSLLSVTKSMDI